MSWADALGWTARRFREAHRPARPGRGGLLWERPARQRGGVSGRQAVQGVDLGTNNTDSNSRLCMASAVAGYRTSLGADGPPCCYADIDLSDCLVVWGTNMAEAFPVTFDRVKAHLKANPGVELIVVDPRRTITAASRHALRPRRPRRRHPADERRRPTPARAGRRGPRLRRGAHRGLRSLPRFPPARRLGGAGHGLGRPGGAGPALADRVARSRACLTFYCMGLNQSTVGTWKNNSLINLHLLTGQIGKPGAGPFSLTGQPNAMGGREVGLLAQALPGLPVRRGPRAPRRGRGVLGTSRGDDLDEAGLDGRRDVPGAGSRAAQGDLDRGDQSRGQPARPAPGPPRLVQGRTGRRPGRLPSDGDDPVRRRPAPARRSGPRRTLTSTNSERIVAFSEPVVDPPGAALPDWEILAKFAQIWVMPGFRFEDSDAVWDEFIGLTAGRPCDMAGMTSERLRRETTPAVALPERRPSGDRAALSRPEIPDARRPRPLLRGRTAPARVDRPRVPADPDNRAAVCPLAHPDPHGQVAQARPARAGAVRRGPPRRRGRARLGRRPMGRAEQPSRPDPPPGPLNPGLSPGVVFVPFHWGDEQRENGAANYLTISAIDRIAKQPELKYCAVRLAPALRRPGATPDFGADAAGRPRDRAT